MIIIDGDKYKITIGFGSTGGSKEVNIYVASSDGCKIPSGLLLRIVTGGLRRWCGINPDVCIDMDKEGYLVIDGIDLLE